MNGSLFVCFALDLLPVGYCVVGFVLRLIWPVVLRLIASIW